MIWHYRMLRLFVPVIPCFEAVLSIFWKSHYNATKYTLHLFPPLPVPHTQWWVPLVPIWSSCNSSLSIMPSIIYHLQASVTNPKAPSLRHWWFFSLGYSRFRLDKNDESWIIFWAMPHLSSLQLPPVCLLIWGWRQNRWDLYHTSQTMAVGD